MTAYPFYLVRHNRKGELEDKSLLAKRPFSEIDRSFQADAKRFVPGDRLENAINTAIAVGEPLLITGEPGTGKTQTAYYAAHKLGIEPVLHFQVKSDSSARDLLYNFDTVRYFHDAHLLNLDKNDPECTTTLNKADYVEPRALWEAFKTANETGMPRVLLIDEIDKAPRDFPNDLLHELDKMEFTVTEIGKTISAPRNLTPMVFITSNSERRLPEPFLRRCVYHHIRFDDLLVQKAVESRREEFRSLSDDFVEMALKRFLALRDRGLRKAPATGELLVWLRVLALEFDRDPAELRDKLYSEDLSKLPYLGVLLKDHQDVDEL